MPPQVAALSRRLLRRSRRSLSGGWWRSPRRTRWGPICGGCSFFFRLPYVHFCASPAKHPLFAKHPLCLTRCTLCFFLCSSTVVWCEICVFRLCARARACVYGSPGPTRSIGTLDRHTSTRKSEKRTHTQKAHPRQRHPPAKQKCQLAAFARSDTVGGGGGAARLHRLALPRRSFSCPRAATAAAACASRVLRADTTPRRPFFSSPERAALLRGGRLGGAGQEVVGAVAALHRVQRGC